MEINFAQNAVTKKIGRSSWNCDNNGFIEDILEGVQETSLYDVGEQKPPADLVWLMCLAFIAGQKDGIRAERKRRRAYEAKKGGCV